jgi:hypothetical protein
MPGLGRFCCIVLSAAPWIAAGAQAQVDWSELLGEKGNQPAVEAPQRQEASPGTAQPPEQRQAQAHGAAKGHSKPTRVRQIRPPAARRPLTQPDPEDEREYPAVPAARRR